MFEDDVFRKRSSPFSSFDRSIRHSQLSMPDGAVSTTTATATRAGINYLEYGFNGVNESNGVGEKQDTGPEVDTHWLRVDLIVRYGAPACRAVSTFSTRSANASLGVTWIAMRFPEMMKCGRCAGGVVAFGIVSSVAASCLRAAAVG